MHRETRHKISLNNIRTWFSENETFAAVTVTSIILIIYVIIALLQPDNGPAKIKKELEKAGYDVSYIEFVYVGKKDFWSDPARIYRSSRPIEYLEDVFVDQWELKTFQYGITALISHWVVKPYPEVPGAVFVDLRLTITQKDYDQLKEQAGGQNVEEYVKRIIRNNIKDTGGNGHE